MKISPVKKPKPLWKKFLMRVLLLFFLFSFLIVGFLFYKVSKLEKRAMLLTSASAKMRVSNNSIGEIFSLAKNLITSEKVALRGEDEGRINILLLGMGGEGHQGKDLTDTIMLISIDPENYRSALLSIPRDLYVNIPKTKSKTKINAVYAYGLRNKKDRPVESLESLKDVVKKVTGQEVDYYVALDFEGFKKIIDELGGINVEVKEDIYDPRYPGPNYSYETFQIKKGFHHLDADTALKYARVRHTKGGDFSRAARQQQVITAAKKKALSLETILNPIKIIGLLDVLSDHLKTDIALSEIPSFVDLAKNVDTSRTSRFVLDAWQKDSLLAASHAYFGRQRAFILVPKAKNYSQVHELSTNIFDLEVLKRRKEELKKENAQIVIIPENSGDYHKTRELFNDLGYNQVKISTSSYQKELCEDYDSVVSYAARAKVFTLSDIAAKLDTTVQYGDTGENTFDIAVCLSGKTLAKFEEKESGQKAQDMKEESRSTTSGSGVVDEKGKVIVNEE